MEAPISINDLELVKQLKEGSPLLCPICFDIFIDPQRISCGHVFCSGCLKDIKTNLTCPLDRTAILIDQAHPDRLLADLINDLHVYCLRKNKGCPWVGEYTDFDYHNKECKFLGDEPSENLQLEAILKELETGKSRIAHLETKNGQLEARVATLEKLVQLMMNERNRAPQDQIKITLPQIITKITDAISQGAPIYDRQKHKDCYLLYHQTTSSILDQAVESQKSDFWYHILKRALFLAETANGAQNWGCSTDGAWTLRRAFEAVKLGAALRGSYSKSDYLAFWERISDPFHFCQLAKAGV